MFKAYINICDEIILEISFNSIKLYEKCCLDFLCVQDCPTKSGVKIIKVKYVCENIFNEDIFVPCVPIKNLGSNMFYILDSFGCYQGIAACEEILLKQYSWLIFYAISENLDKNKYFPLHASAVCNSNGAMLIAGDKGAGKSSLAHHMIVKYGYQFLGDEFLLLKTTEQKIINIASTIMLQTDTDKKATYNYVCEASAQLKHCFFPVLAPMIKTPHIQILSADFLLQAMVKNRWGGMAYYPSSLKQISHQIKGYLLTLGLSIEQNSLLLDKLHNVED